MTESSLPSTWPDSTQRDHLEEEPNNGQLQSLDVCPFKPGDFVAVVEERRKLYCPVLMEQIYSLT